MASEGFDRRGSGGPGKDGPPSFASWMKAPVKASLPFVQADGHKWSEIHEYVTARRGAVLGQYMKLSDTELLHVRSTHVHGDFATKPVFEEDTGTVMAKHNIATSALSESAESLPALAGRIGAHGATNTMRVLKGSNTRKAAAGTTGEVGAAALLGAEIGVSEYGRGGGAAVLNAMSALYLVKRGRLSAAEFADHTKGFKGAGGGGADRLRSLQQTVARTGDPAHALHMDSLRAEYEAHAVNKPGKGWREKGFEAWVRHKVAKWSQRV